MKGEVRLKIKDLRRKTEVQDQFDKYMFALLNLSICFYHLFLQTILSFTHCFLLPSKLMLPFSILIARIIN